jgi:ORF6N domain-containing protein
MEAIMVDDQSLIPLEQIERSILFIRGQKVMIDRDLAKLYGTTTKKLNQAIKRNRARFPSDFMFQLTLGEKQEVVTDCDHLKGLRFSPVLPNAFTEHGAIMAASVLNTPCAVQASVFVFYDKST